jgi:TolA-binding protein
MGVSDEKTEKTRWEKLWKKAQKSYWKLIVLAFSVVVAIGWGGTDPDARPIMGFGAVAAFALIAFILWRRAIVESRWPGLLLLLSVTFFALVVRTSVDSDFFRLASSLVKLGYWEMSMPSGIEPEISLAPTSVSPRAKAPSPEAQNLSKLLNELRKDQEKNSNRQTLAALEESIRQASQDIEALEVIRDYQAGMERRLQDLEAAKVSAQKAKLSQADHELRSAIEETQRIATQLERAYTQIRDEIFDRLREGTYQGLLALPVNRVEGVDWRTALSNCLSSEQRPCEVSVREVLRELPARYYLANYLILVNEYTTLPIGRILEASGKLQLSPSELVIVYATRRSLDEMAARSDPVTLVDVYRDGDPDRRPLGPEWISASELSRLRAGSGAPGSVSISIGAYIGRAGRPPDPTHEQLRAWMLNAMEFYPGTAITEGLYVVVLPRGILPPGWRICVGLTCL